MANDDEDALKPTTKEEVIVERVQELRSELERLGRWGIVTWCDADVITALEHAGADPTSQNIKAVREHLYVQYIDDRMTEVGFDLIAGAIGDLGLAPLITLAKKRVGRQHCVEKSVAVEPVNPKRRIEHNPQFDEPHGTSHDKNRGNV